MTRKFDGKILLVLGSSTMASEGVKYAKANGAYTIVTDYLPACRSKAKQVADEIQSIDTADTERLVAFCRERKVSGVYAGISEFNLLQAMRVSEGAGLRFYFNKSQWDRIENKDQFSDLCSSCGVKTPKVYFTGSKERFMALEKKQLVYPLVVKPVDGSSSRGVSICYAEDTLTQAVDEAFQISTVGRIIIEQYIHGYEFTAHYTICNGKAALTCIDNRYPVAVHEFSMTTIPGARVYPSLFKDGYICKMNQGVCRMCESLDLKYGIVFVQGIYSPDEDEFYIFEAGLRSAAEAPSRFLERFTKQNHLNMIIDYILLGEAQYDLSNECLDLDGKCCATISFASAGGVVKEINGINTACAQLPQILEVELRYPIGARVPDGDTLRQIMIRFVISCKNRDELVHIIAQLNKMISVKDEYNEEMLIGINPERVLGLE